MTTFHHHLCKKSPLYHKWHEWSYYSHLHWLIFLCVGIVAFNAVFFQIKVTFEPMEFRVYVPKVQAQSTEILGRGLIARPKDGGVYLGWRLLKNDPQNVGFDIYRSDSLNGSYAKINGSPITVSTNYQDTSASSGNTYYYFVRKIDNNEDSNKVQVTAGSSNHQIVIRLIANDTISKVVTGDMNGDGVFDFVVVTPFVEEGQTTPPPTPFYLEGVLSESGTWQSKWRILTNFVAEKRGYPHEMPTIIWDMDGDNKGEIITRVVDNGVDSLVLIDGTSGTIKKRVSWPSLNGDPDNDQRRNYMAIAYLDGTNPHIVIQRGLYANQRLVAYDNNLNLVRDSSFGGEGRGTHGLQVIDIDGDGKDEVLMGATLIDDNWAIKWKASSVHVDTAMAADIDPNNPGLEVFLGDENAYPEKALLVDSQGKIIWEKSQPEGQDWERGYVANMTDTYAGLESFVLAPNGEAVLFNASGKDITNEFSRFSDPTSFDAARSWAVDWEKGEGLKEFYTFGNVPGAGGSGWYTGWIGDIFGDSREESITHDGSGSFSIYTNISLNDRRYVTPLNDRGYRRFISAVGVGYNNNYMPVKTGEGSSTSCIPSTEVCDQKDNNCDGNIDEGNVCGGGPVCPNGTCESSLGETPQSCPQDCVSDGWISCANENEFCSFSGTKEVRYGANSSYNYLTLTGGTQCSNTVFGDPINGVVKQCHYRDTTTGGPVCPNGTCEPPSETNSTCPQDCGSTQNQPPRNLLLRYLGPTPTGGNLPSNTIVLTGTRTTKYTATVPDGTLIDATQWTSTAVGPSPTGTGSKGAEIYGTGLSSGGKNIIWRGGVIKGSIPTSWDWTTTHNFGGSGITIFNNGPAEWQYIRVHNVEDGMKSREAPEYSNTASFLVRDCYMTAIRDDAIEDDRFEPGTVENCLFDGVYTFISEQNENVGLNDPIGPTEDTTIYLKKVYVRSYPTNATPDSTANRFMGSWFKLQGRGVQNHNISIEDSVFAVGQSAPDMKWSNFDSPPEVSWVGNNNYILWLGNPGGYQGAKPPGVHFLEGQAAHDKWIEVRNRWLTDHGLPAQTFPADYNPHTAPLAQIPVSATPL